MKKLYTKHELAFSLIWIALYVVLFSLADSISMSLGISKILTAPLGIAMTVMVYFWICKHGLKEKYGLCRFQGTAKQYLYFIPLILLITVNFWWGFRLNVSIQELILYVISMVCVGFLEEVIFRGFLFKAMYKDNAKSAIAVSSITFGIGHIVNLLNGSAVQETLLQICYAVAIGFLFTILFFKGKSLWPCIIVHSVNNSLSIFENQEAAPAWGGVVTCIFLCAVSLIYVMYILKKTGTASEHP